MSSGDQINETRSSVFAAILAILSPGLGMLYVGRGVFALLVPIVMLMLLALFSWSRFLLFPIGFWLAIASISVFMIFVIFASCKYANTASREPKYWYQRWYVYILFFLLAPMINSVIFENGRDKIFGFETHRITSNSMQPALISGDYILADAWAFNSQSIESSDVIVYTPTTQPDQLWVKRVIGLPRDTVEISNGRVFLSGKRLNEPYVDENNNIHTARKPFSAVVPEGHYFVLGDNRDNSADSRFHSFVPAVNVKSKVSSIWLSRDESGFQFNRIGLLNK